MCNSALTEGLRVYDIPQPGTETQLDRFFQRIFHQFPKPNEFVLNHVNDSLKWTDLLLTLLPLVQNRTRFVVSYLTLPSRTCFVLVSFHVCSALHLNEILVCTFPFALFLKLL